MKIQFFVKRPADYQNVSAYEPPIFSMAFEFPCLPRVGDFIVFLHPYEVRDRDLIVKSVTLFPTWGSLYSAEVVCEFDVHSSS